MLMLILACLLALGAVLGGMAVVKCILRLLAVVGVFRFVTSSLQIV